MPKRGRGRGRGGGRGGGRGRGRNAGAWIEEVDDSDDSDDDDGWETDEEAGDGESDEEGLTMQAYCDITKQVCLLGRTNRAQRLNRPVAQVLSFGAWWHKAGHEFDM
jgi:hypothetical protein